MGTQIKGKPFMMVYGIPYKGPFSERIPIQFETYEKVKSLLENSVAQWCPISETWYNPFNNGDYYFKGGFVRLDPRFNFLIALLHENRDGLEVLAQELELPSPNPNQ